MLTGKLKFRGEMSLGITLGHWIRKAMALEAAAPDRLQALDRGKWERDEDAKRCAVCRKDFTVSWRVWCKFPRQQWQYSADGMTSRLAILFHVTREIQPPRHVCRPL